MRGVCSYRPHPRLARALDIMFTLHAEHEMNCSTAAARHLASSGVDVYTAIAGALDQDLCFQSPSQASLASGAGWATVELAYFWCSRCQDSKPLL